MKSKRMRAQLDEWANTLTTKGIVSIPIIRIESFSDYCRKRLINIRLGITIASESVVVILDE